MTLSDGMEIADNANFNEAWDEFTISHITVQPPCVDMNADA